MQIKTITSAESSIDVQLPFFCKDAASCQFFKVFSEEECLKIYKSSYYKEYSIAIQHAGAAFAFGYIKIDESEFLEKFKLVNDYLFNIVMQTKPTCEDLQMDVQQSRISADANFSKNIIATINEEGEMLNGYEREQDRVNGINLYF